jgi:hypothetical protein
MYPGFDVGLLRQSVGIYQLLVGVALFRRGFIAEVHAPLDVLMQHLPAVVQGHPIEEVRATDKEPYFDESASSNKYRWYIDDSGHPNAYYSIGPLWRLLPNTIKVNDYALRNSGYDTTEAAQADLSQTLIRRAREQARLV